MVDEKKLEAMMMESTKRGSSDTLPDLLDIKIEGETLAQRWESYLSQIGDPYHFRVGKTPVRLLFHNEEKSLQEKLKSYFLSLKSNDFL